jgi:peptide/nickel transport system substrate-binding protein
MESRSMRLSVILLVSLLVVGTLLLGACGGESTTTTAPPSTQPGATSTSQSTGSTGTSGTTATSAALAPKYGGTLRIVAMSNGANIGWPATLQTGGMFVMSYYETLLRSDNKGNLLPWLAESYQVADDQTSITFTIRKGVKFSDGSDLTAEVVKWNLEQYMTQAGGAPAGAPPAGAPAGAPPAGAEPPAGGPPPGMGGGSPWGSIEVVDAYTVRVNITQWDNSLPASFGDADPALYMVSKAAYDTNGQEWMTTNPVGTGAFTLVSYVTDTTAKLVKNPNYWATDAQGNKLPYLDGLDFTFTADPTTTLMMAKAGEVDMILNTSPGKQLADYEDLGWRVNRSYDSNEVWVPDSAHTDSPWSKLEVREAAEYAVDRVTIAEKFGFGYLQAPNQIPPRDTTAYDADYALGRTYDPEKAKELLAQAGYPDGFKTTLIIWPAGNRDIALAEQQYLAAVGIQAEIEFADFGKWSSYVGPLGTYHNALLEAPCPAQGPTGLGCVTFAVGLFGNNWQKPPELMQALGAATSSPAPDVNLIRATTDILSKNALLIPLWEIGSARVEQPYVVAEFGTRGLPTFSSLETAWLNK